MTLAIDPSETSAASPAPLSDLVARDAREFGAYVRTGSWTFGLMVAGARAQMLTDARGRHGGMAAEKRKHRRRICGLGSA